MRGRVTRSEWRWALAWILVALIVTSIPYVVGWLRSTPERVFGGFVIGIEDGYQYLSMMNEGARGAWLFHLPYTSEPHSGTLLYVYYLVLGKAAAVLYLSPILVYHLARLVSGALLLGVIYRLLAIFTAVPVVRRIAFLLIVFSGGLGWLLLLLGLNNWFGSLPIDLYVPEAYTFLILYGWPHIALARALLLLGFIVFWGEPNAGFKLPYSWLAGLCWLGTGLLVPFYVGVVAAIAVAGAAARAVLQRRFDWHEVRAVVVALLLPALVVIYTFLLVTIDPIWRQWLAQNVVLSPHPVHYVAGFAVLGGSAIIGLIKTWKRRRIPARVIGWLMIVPLLWYAPFTSQRRLIESWQIPLGLCAAVGLVYVVLPAWSRSHWVQKLVRHSRYTKRGLRQVALAGIVVLAAGTYGLLVTEQSMRIFAQLPPAFRDRAELDALTWLDQHTTDEDVVLSSYNTGNFLSTRVGARAFIGHGVQTAFVEEKRQLVAKFYDAATPDEWRRSFLRKWPITFVVVGPLEQKLGAVDFSRADYLTLEYDRAGYQIYRVAEAAR